MRESDTLIVGAGASGLAAAAAASSAGDKVILLEAQDRPGRKLLATGNGRCNLMNLGEPVYYGDRHFAEKVFRFCGRQELELFWHSIGLQLRSEDNRVYPCTFQAFTVLDVLLARLRRNQVELLTGQRVQFVRRMEGGYTAVSETGERYRSSRVIIAAGGPAQPKLGGCSDGFDLLNAFGHRMAPPRPALTPLFADHRAISGLSGIRVRCEIRMMCREEEKHRERGELLFTDEGISGICVMQCARFVEPGRSTAVINLVPDLFEGTGSLLAFLHQRKEAEPEEEPPSLLRGICMPRLAWAVCKQAGLSLRGETNADLSDAALQKVAAALTSYQIPIRDSAGMERAQVCAGGILCRDFHPSTLESRLSPGLFAAGEVLNVDGDCGGFNLMFAWASGILAGKNGRTMRC